MSKSAIRNKVARKLLSDEIDKFKKKNYEKLKSYLGPRGVQVHSIRDESGEEYVIEIEAFWDGDVGGNLRLVVGVSMGGWRSYFPMTDDFIISPDGQFIDNDC